MLEVEDERCGEQDADQAGDEREPVGEVQERLEALPKTAELVPAGRAGIDREARCEPVLVVGVRHLDAGRDEERGKQGEDADGDQRLGSLQAPADPGHDRTASTGRRRGRAVPGLVAEVGEHDLLEVDLVLLPAAVVDVPVGAHEQRRLPFGVALADDVVHARDARGVAARAGQQPVARDDLRDRSVQLRGALGERDQVIADALELGDDVGGENDRDPLVDDGLHHRVQELAARERVERGHRLVEQQQPRLLGERQRQRDLCLLAAGELTDLLLRGKAETLDSRGGQLLVPARVELAPVRERLGDRQVPVQRMVLRDEAEPRQHLLRVAPR